MFRALKQYHSSNLFRDNDNYTLKPPASLADLGFGIQIEPLFGFSYDDIKRIALEAEGLGFESLWVSDHYFLNP